MEILNTMLGIIMVVAFLTFLWILPIVLGLKLAKRNKVSSYWMLFGIYPGLAWIGYVIIRLNGRIDQVENVSVQWTTGKAACPSCAKFNPMNNNFCSQCRIPIPKPICPRCKGDQTRFVGHVGQYIWSAILLMVIGGVILNGSENIRSVGAVITYEDLVVVLLAVPFLIASLVYFFKPLSRNTKRIKCLSCGAESSVSSITGFQQTAARGTVTPVTQIQSSQKLLEQKPSTEKNTPNLEGIIHRYLSYGYDLISDTEATAIMQGRAPINPVIMLAWVIMFFPIAIYYAIPDKRKLYRVQLDISNEGQINESGGTIEQFEQDKKRAWKTGWVLLIIAIPVFICIVSIGIANEY